MGTIFASIFRPPKNNEKGGGAGEAPWGVWTLSPPSSDSSPLVKPLRVLPSNHRTHWASQSFPEQKTSVSSPPQSSVASEDIVEPFDSGVFSISNLSSALRKEFEGDIDFDPLLATMLLEPPR